MKPNMNTFQFSFALLATCTLICAPALAQVSASTVTPASAPVAQATTVSGATVQLVPATPVS